MSLREALAVLALGLGFHVFSAPAAERAWFGKGESDNWSASANWYDGVIPANWDEVFFPENVGDRLDNRCDISGLKLTRIRVESPGDLLVTGGFSLGDQDGFREGGGIDMSSATHQMTIQADVRLHAIQDWTVAANRTLTSTGVLSDDGEIPREKILHKNGPGTLVIAGNAANLGISLQINAGIVELAKSSGPNVHAVTRITRIESGATLRLGGTGDDQIPDNSDLTELCGTFALNGRNEGLGVFLNPGADAVVTNSGNADSTFTLGFNGGSCSFPGLLTDGGPGKLALRKVGAGTFTPANPASTFSGGVRIAGGTLVASTLADRGHPSVLGSDGTIAWESDGTPAILQITGTRVSTNRNFAVSSSLANRVEIGAGRQLTIRGALTETVPGAALMKTGHGTLTLAGVNAFTGTTSILAGTLELVGSSSSTSSADVFISPEGILKVSAGTHAFADVTGTGILDLGGGTLTASRIVQHTLRVGPGAKVMISPLPSAPAGTAAPHPVPEPSGIVLLLAALAGGWRIGNTMFVKNRD
jgi:autotransporter-associated beta strand protein